MIWLIADTEGGRRQVYITISIRNWGISLYNDKFKIYEYIKVTVGRGGGEEANAVQLCVAVQFNIWSFQSLEFRGYIMTS